jgi:GNAT superfamily N-acetyltransferase
VRRRRREAQDGEPVDGMGRRRAHPCGPAPGGNRPAVMFPDDLPVVGLRPAVELDLPFLLALHEGAFRRYVESYWGWRADQQEELYKRRFAESPRQIVTVDGTDAGCLCVTDTEDAIRVLYIALLTAYQGRGIGTYLLRAVLDKAAAASKPVTTRAFRSNPACALYARLGFVAAGEDETHIYLRAEPAAFLKGNAPCD